MHAMTRGLVALIAAIAGTAAVPPAFADDLAEVRAVLQTEIRLFDVYDAKLAAQVYAPDVIWQNPFGVRIRSEGELERFLTRLFNRPGYRSGKDTSPPVVTDVKLLGPEAAVAWGEETSAGQVEDGKPLGVRKSHYLEVLRKRDGMWRVTDEMIMDEK
jgi:uncharacterized protein (TIGR02246 family)